MTCHDLACLSPPRAVLGVREGEKEGGGREEGGGRGRKGEEGREGGKEGVREEGGRL